MIAKNLYPLCKEQQRLLSITYHDYVLHNWRLIDKNKGITLDNIEPIITFTGTNDEAWFIKIHVAIEATSGKALFLLQKMNEYLRHQPLINSEKIINSLNKITDTLADMRALMQRMKEHCDPHIFWNVLRPYLMGWEKIKSPQEGPNGVMLEGIAIQERYNYSGPSGAQSSIIPALDGVFAIKHDINSMSSYLNNFKNYMSKKHQSAILLFAQHPLNKFVTNNSIDERLMVAYRAAVKGVELFRGSHLHIVHDYIHNPAKSQGIDIKHITGTGGTPDHYLAGRYRDTQKRRQEIELCHKEPSLALRMT